MNPIRVLVVDDHAMLREGVCALLAQHSDVRVVGQASDGLEAVKQTLALQPDVVLMDISMPRMDGLQATREIKAQRPETRVLILTQYESKEYAVALLQAGVAGYILKKAGGAELVEAIRAVHSEGAFLHPSIARTLMAEVKKTDDLPQARLTRREQEVLVLVAEGLTSREIAEKLVLSERTVVVHRNNLMEKLQIHNRAELVRYAIRQGLIQA